MQHKNERRGFPTGKGKQNVQYGGSGPAPRSIPDKSVGFPDGGGPTRPGDRSFGMKKVKTSMHQKGL